MKSNIALIGFMGSGKSTVGKRLARRLGRNFIETDHLIEQQAGMSIVNIFKSGGETEFRDLETAVITSVSDIAENSVIACGGGVVARPGNIERLKSAATVVYLQTGTAALNDRLAFSRKRPLLDRPDREQFIRELEATRRPLYEAAADITVRTGNRPFAAVIDEIIRKLDINESPNQ
ncbi:MAG: shikimate kinase [Dehalogenimonas sp.]|uniref:Shikimate kinase n=1 Tax=Candidatus Dehalogenimonas loeffleri TaxID=3127115 RepID=A0ABZ2J1K6_9CHLR|nr:shikimate kinase [Dehalogenimonas sp.]